MPCRLEPFEAQSLTNPNECLIENVICAWLERIDGAVLLANRNQKGNRGGTDDGEKNNEDAAHTTATAGPNAPPPTQHIHGGHGFVLLADFSLLHAAAMFNEPSMLAEHLGIRASLDLGAALPEEGDALNASSTVANSTSSSEAALSSMHTLWILSGLADFWSGDEDGEHYSCVLVRIHNATAAAKILGGAAAAAALDPLQQTNAGTQTTTTTRADGSATDNAIEVFLFDSSGERNVALSGRLVRLVTNALAACPALGPWLGEAVGGGGPPHVGEAAVGNVPMWAWAGSPRQFSAVGCGVFMSAHLEALTSMWVSSQKGGGGNAGGKPNGLGAIAEGIRSAQNNTPTCVLRLGGGASHDDDEGTSGSTCAPSCDAARNGGAALSAYLADHFYGPHGTGRSFESNYRKHMASTLGIGSV